MLPIQSTMPVTERFVSGLALAPAALARGRRRYQARAMRQPLPKPSSHTRMITIYGWSPSGASPPPDERVGW